MPVEFLDIVRATNAGLARFLSSAVVPDEEGSGIHLAAIEDQLELLFALIERTSREFRPPSALEGLDTEARAEIALYAGHLERLRVFLMSLHTYAESRRSQLLASAQKISEARAWCNTLRLTTPE